MKTSTLVEKAKELGIDMVSSKFETSFYAFDVTPLPKEAYWIFRGTVPQVILRPKNAEEVAKVMKFSNEYKVPVTPRGGGTSGYLQSVPRKRGIVIETLVMEKIGTVNPDTHTVEVGAGTIWSQIDWELKKQGYTLKTYPTSYKSSTVAGWMQTEGLGVGSLMYGSIRKLIKSIEAVLPSGDIVRLSQGEIAKSESSTISFEDFFKGEGMLGIITSVELEVRKIPEITDTKLLAFNSHEHFSKYAKELGKLPGLYFVEFVNGSYMDLLIKAGFHSPPHSEDTISAVIRFEGNKKTVEEGIAKLGEIVKSDSTIKEYDKHEAEEEYGERLRYFRIKNAYTSVTPADISVPTDNLSKYLNKVQKFNFKAGFKGELLTPELSGLMFFYVLANELSLIRFMATAPYQMEFILAAMKMGGAPNGGVGLLNTPYVYGLKTQKERADFIEKKEKLDPNWIMNPGKWADPLFILRPSLYFPVMKLLEPVCFVTSAITRRW